MAQFLLTQEERTRALQRLGYSAREALFICLSALHGGYFMRRQYCQFVGISAGGTVAILIDKLLTKGHARATTFAANTHVYHLCSRPLYAALGQEDNRNRRLRQPATIKNKLMGLDFVLGHSDREYLATEQEKVDFFTAQLGIEHAVLPAKRYRGKDGVTDRYFVEKYPIFVPSSSHSPTPPSVGFCFIDEGQSTLSHFWTYLQSYGPLFARLQSFQLAYVASEEGRLEQATQAFARFCRQTLSPQRAEINIEDAGRILEHFEMRQRYEAQQWSSFDRASLIQFRNERRTLSGDHFEGLYRCWKTAGSAAIKRILDSQKASVPPPQPEFLTYRIDQNYDFFGYLRGC